MTHACDATANLARAAAGLSLMTPWAVLAVARPYHLYERLLLLAEKSGSVVENASFGAYVALTALLSAGGLQAAKRP